MKASSNLPGLCLGALFFMILNESTAQSNEGCNCPVSSTCRSCAGGISSLTFRYTGADLARVRVSDSGIIFDKHIAPDEVFTVRGTANGRFRDNFIRLFIDEHEDSPVPINCGRFTFNPFEDHGSFRIVAAESKDGGAVCCTSTSGDDVPPVISECPPDMTVIATTCGAAVTWTPPVVSDCSPVTLSCTRENGGIVPIGRNQVIYTARDAHGNTSQCSFYITVTDPPPTVANCPANITAVADASCRAQVTWTPPRFADNCVVIVSGSHKPNDTFGKGTTRVTYSGEDKSGNITTCAFDVEVVDTQAVIGNCPQNITVFTSTIGDMVAATWTPPTASGSCAPVSLVGSHTPGTLFPIGTTTVTYSHPTPGVNATCSFDVTVAYERSSLNIVEVLTPDGNGINDTWQIGNIEKYINNTVTIFDRWGSVVYTASGYDNERVVWRGDKVPTGTYFYTITVHAGPEVREQKGFIELAR